LGEWSALTCGTDHDPDADCVISTFKGASIDFDRLHSAHDADVVSALKNAYAIVMGIAASLGLSDNTNYLLITKILKEIGAVMKELQIEDTALASYCGIGDILLTSLCDTSRNRTLGIMIGKGIPVDPLRNDFLAEGVRTIDILLNHVQTDTAPILKILHEIMYGGQPATSIVRCFDGSWRLRH
jgi:glycerol-3-phosphate dehydrogenase (NAD(P)+)